MTGPGFTYACNVDARRREVAFDYHWETTAREIMPAQWVEYCRQRGKAFEHSGANVNTKPFTFRDLGAGAAVVWIALIVVGAINGTNGTASKSPSRTSASADTRELERDMRLAYEAAGRGDFRVAEPLVEKLRPYYSASYEYQLLRADVAIHMNQLDRARLAISAARQCEPSKIGPDVFEARLHEELGEFPAARDLLDRVLAKSPDDSTALFLLGRVADRMGDGAAAHQAWEKCLALSPAQPEVIKAYSVSLWNSGEREKADRVMIAAVRGQPSPSAAMEGAAADYLSATGRYTDAVGPAARAAKLAQRDVAAAFRYVMVLARAGDTSGATLRATQMTSDFPDNPGAWYALSTSAASAGQNEVAEKAFHKWLKLSPREPLAHSNYGFFLHRTGRSTEARAELAQAAHDFPASGHVWLNLSVVLEALGDAQAAAEAKHKADTLMSSTDRALLLK